MSSFHRAPVTSSPSAEARAGTPDQPRSCTRPRAPFSFAGGPPRCAHRAPSASVFTNQLRVHEPHSHALGRLSRRQAALLGRLCCTLPGSNDAGVWGNPQSTRSHRPRLLADDTTRSRRSLEPSGFGLVSDCGERPLRSSPSCRSLETEAIAHLPTPPSPVAAFAETRPFPDERGETSNGGAIACRTPQRRADTRCHFRALGARAETRAT